MGDRYPETTVAETNGIKPATVCSGRSMVGGSRGDMSEVVAPHRPEWVGYPPVELTSLIGRDGQCVEVGSLLLRPAVRLVTLTGPGGVGKSRLGLRVAADLESGVDTIAFVPLAPVRDPGLVAAAIAGTLGVAAPDSQVADALRAHLRPRSMLLVLDNFEHVLDAAPLVAGLLSACPGLTALVTSRARLRISGEHVVAVAPLMLPDVGSARASEVERYAAVRLFVERARAVDPGFVLAEGNAGDVVEICRRLDGLPLAIELAAARCALLPPAALLARLQRRLPVLTDGPRDVPERLRTMRAGIAWSYDLLPPAERELFRRAAVFAGTCSLTALEEVAAGPGAAALDVVGSLVEKSLLQRSPGDAGNPRVTMLETIREFAVEQLVASGEEEAARRAHARHYCAVAEAAEPELRGPEQQRWRDELEADLDNFRAALSWTLRESGSVQDADDGLRLVGALWYFWFQRGLTVEGRHWLMRALEFGPGGGRARAQALLGAGTLAWRQGDCVAAHGYLDESVGLWRSAAGQADRAGLVGLAEALHVLGHVRFDQRDFPAARDLFTEGLDGYRRADDTIGGLPLAGDLGLVAYHEGDYATAEAVFRDSLAVYRRYELKDRVAGVLNALGDLARLAGDGRQAAARYTESLTLWRELHGTPGIASSLHKLGQVSRSESDPAGARAQFLESLRLQRELGNKQGIAECLAALAGLALELGPPERAARLAAASSALLDAIGVPLAPADATVLAQDTDAIRKLLSARDWDAAWAAGSALTVEQAATLALDDAGDPPRRVVPTRTRGECADRPGSDQPADLPNPVHQREDSGQPHRAHHDQAGRALADPHCGVCGRAPPWLGSAIRIIPDATHQRVTEDTRCLADGRRLPLPP
jgi:predicted ATPase